MLPPFTTEEVIVDEDPCSTIVLPAIEIEDVCNGFTVMVTVLLFTVAGEAQGSLLVNSTLTSTSLVGLMVSVAAFVPAFAPFTSHWYWGAVPSLVEVAVKETGSPSQIVPDDATIDTVGVRVPGVTFMVTVSVYVHMFASCTSTT